MDRKAIIGGVIFFTLLFGGSWAFRRYRDRDIESHRKYGVAKVVRRLFTTKNGEQFQYTFVVKGDTKTGYRSSHVDYHVKVGDYFLVTYSSVIPSHNKLLYEYKLQDTARIDRITNISWDTIPSSILHHEHR